MELWAYSSAEWAVFLRVAVGGGPLLFPGQSHLMPPKLCPPGNVRVHPTQVYESLVGLVLFFYVQHRFKHRKYTGQIFLEMISIYSVARFGIEFFRGDDYRGYLFGGLISYSQFISLAILPFSVSAMYHFSKENRSET